VTAVGAVLVGSAALLATAVEAVPLVADALTLALVATPD